jgi:hypothetical protein
MFRGGGGMVVSGIKPITAPATPRHYQPAAQSVYGQHTSYGIAGEHNPLVKKHPAKSIGSWC